MDTTSILSVVAIVLSTASTILGIINHKRIHSECCGKVSDISIDIDDTRDAKVKPLNNVSTV
jgi:hypothetical protein